MIDVRQTDVFTRWIGGIEANAKARILARIRRLGMGNAGDSKTFGSVGEMRIDYGPGYRVYFTRKGRTIFVLLCGGDKRTQPRDIRVAQRMAKEV
ncbi:type II toxin-antitoxin system RelE/ParE family toxin [Bradyrhizobium sp. LB11.1]|uniref:type II toxin-antitoxin system RelE/ParE family toxin n=1 Tax=Bradyrhizobium sp. LB11.1 TaxID=3156326 RepID=UPI0033922B15